jgi:arylsulfatase A-like enzyme
MKGSRSRLSWVIFPLVAAATVAVGCGRQATDSGPPNILLISIDALRADHLGFAGYDRATSPELDRLAARGIRFSQAFVNTHGTPPSHATLLSSLYQETHRVGIAGDRGGHQSLVLPEELPLVQEILQDAGWFTVAITGGGYMAEDFGFSRGFDVFQTPGGRVTRAAGVLVEELSIREADRRPVFAFFHTYQVHSPYKPPPKFRSLYGDFPASIEATSEALLAIQSQAGEVLTEVDFDFLEALYDGEIRYTDEVLGEMLRALEESGFLENAVVIITSDHGEEFGEHGGVLHGGTLFDELLRVPLVIFGTGVPHGRVDPALVSLVDVAPTILALAGLPAPSNMEGRNLFNRTPDQSWAGQRLFAQYGDRLFCVRTPRWKLIHRQGGVDALFDLHRDPGEHHNLVNRHPELAAGLRAEIEAWRAARPRLQQQTPQPAQLSPEKIEELRALGYVE